MANQVGEVLRTSLGSYALYAYVASGGFGTVSFGRDLRTNRAVAIKRLHGHLAYQPDVVLRFQQEAQRLRGLQHPNIVQVLDDGTDSSGLPFIILQWVEGWTVATLLEQKGRFPIDEAMEITSQVLAALEAAGRRGVVHRDIKPANLMLTPPPEALIKVMDFGIAKDVLGEAAASNTQVGTLAYMAPEQFSQAGRVDTRTDMYALGVTLYELLAGQRPMLIPTREPPTRLRELRPEVDPALAAIVYRALEPRPTDRFETPTQMRAAIEPFVRRGIDLAVPDEASVTQVVPPPPAPVDQPYDPAQTAVAARREPPTMSADGPTIVEDGPWTGAPPKRHRFGALLWVAGSVAALLVVVLVVQQVVSTQTGQPGVAILTPVVQLTQEAGAGVAVALPTEAPPPATALPTPLPAAPPPTAVPPATAAPAPTAAQLTTAVQQPTAAPTLTLAPAVTPAPTSTPASTATPTLDDLWGTTLAQVEPTWSRDWPATIGVLETFVAAHPGFAAGQEKLYAARLFYATDLLAAGDTDGGVTQLTTARSLLPERPEANQALLALTPTPAPIATQPPRVVATTPPQPRATTPPQQVRPAAPVQQQAPPPSRALTP